MKVALLSDCYLPRLGGIEVQTHDLAGALVAAGHEVEVFTATPGPAGERHGETSVLDGVRVHHVALRLPGDLPVNPLSGPMLRERLATGGFDVGHIQTGVVSPFAWDCVRATGAIGLPTAMTWHCMLDRVGFGFKVAGSVRRWADRGVVMSAVSAVAAEPLHDIVGPGHQVAVLPNGIDVARWQVQPTQAGERDGGPLRLVTAMRLAARKRPTALIDIVRSAEKQAGVGSLELTIFGDGPQRGRVEAHLREHDLGWVRLAGRVSREDLRREYAAHDVYLNPARLESFGIAALEARTVGLPVIGRLGSGISEFVDNGIGGLVVDSDAGMAAAIARLAGDAAEAARMRTWNEQHRPEQDWPSVALLAVAEYERAMAARSRLAR